MYPCRSFVLVRCPAIPCLHLNFLNFAGVTDRPTPSPALLSSHPDMSRLLPVSLALLSVCVSAQQSPVQKSPAREPHVAARPFHLEEATLADTQEALRSGQLTCHKLVQQYLDRIR